VTGSGITLVPLELREELVALVSLPRVHLMRYSGYLAPRSKLRDAIGPTPRQRAVDGEETKTGTPYGKWARLLGRVFALDMVTCPFCATVAHCGSLLPSPMSRLLHASSVISGWRPSHLLLHLPVVAKRYSLATKPTTRGVGSSATCASRRYISPLCACAIPSEIPPPSFPQPGNAPLSYPERHV
jgi:hypothetical protein